MNIEINNKSTFKSSTLENINQNLNIDLIKVKKSKSFKNVFLITLLFCVIVSLTSFGIIFGLSKHSMASIIASDTLNINTSPFLSTIPLTPKITYIPSPLNGELIQSDKFNLLQQNKVLAVMIENLGGLSGARPQAGLQDADIVYETEAEGDITRFMAIYWNNDASTTESSQSIKLEPIRSARKYFLDWLLEYKDPLYMHIGQADSTNSNTDALGALSKYGIKDLADIPGSFNRDHNCEKIKAIEHCAYSDTQTLLKLAQDKGWVNNINSTSSVTTISPFLYKEDKAIDINATTSNMANKVNINFEQDAATYGVNWNYDITNNTYLRSDSLNKPFLDQISKKQIYTKTLIIEKTSIVVDNDIKYHKIIKTLGSDDAWIVQDGKVTLATWKKDSLTSRTHYYNKITNQELAIDRGKIWVTVTSKLPTFL